MLHTRLCSLLSFVATAQDVARHRADAAANASLARALDLEERPGRFRRVEWRNIRVGDMLLVKNRESIPADLLVGGHVGGQVSLCGSSPSVIMVGRRGGEPTFNL